MPPCQVATAPSWTPYPLSLAHRGYKHPRSFCGGPWSLGTRNMDKNQAFQEPSEWPLLISFLLSIPAEE